jgi:hypothetical protein
MRAHANVDLVLLMGIHDGGWNGSGSIGGGGERKREVKAKSMTELWTSAIKRGVINYLQRTAVITAVCSVFYVFYAFVIFLFVKDSIFYFLLIINTRYTIPRIPIPIPTLTHPKSLHIDPHPHIPSTFLPTPPP